MPGRKPTTDVPDLDHGSVPEPRNLCLDRFGNLPSWALPPRDVAIGLAALVAAAVITLLVLSAQ